MDFMPAAGWRDQAEILPNTLVAVQEKPLPQIRRAA
jgi:hypothetical protein